MSYDDETLARHRERWWHFGRCPRCCDRYSDWFVTRKGERYCWPCADREDSDAR